MGRVEYRAWKEEQDRLAAEAKRQELKDRQNMLGRISDELGYQTHGDWLQYGEGNLSQYNPFTGSFGTKGFDYDADKDLSWIGDVRLSGKLDPRIAFDMGEEDYGAADALMESYTNRINKWYEEGVKGGKITPSYRVEGDRFSLGQSAGMWGDPNYVPDYRFDSPFFDMKEYLQGVDPELADVYSMMKDPKKSTEFYTKSAYDTAAERLKGVYTNDYYKGLEQQFGDLKSQLMTPEEKEEYDRTMIETNKNLSSEVKKQILEKQYPAPPTSEVEVPEPIDRSKYNQERELLGFKSRPTQQQEWMYTGATMTSGEYSEQQRKIAEETQTPVAPITGYAETLADKPTLETTGGKIEAPWSPDFEKQLLDQLKGFGTSLDTYLGSLQPQQPTPKFSLQNYLTSTRDEGLNANIPTQNIYGRTSTTAQPSTGKVGQTNQQSIWR